jgi:putative transposase
MRRSRFSDTEIRFFLAEADRGISVEEICRTAGISMRTFYRWRSQIGGLGAPELDRLRLVERENMLLRKALKKSEAPAAATSAESRKTLKRRLRVDCGAGPTYGPDATSETKGPIAETVGANIGRFPFIRTGR